MLEPCLRSTAGHVDEVIIAEGLIEGVPDLGLGAHTDLGWLAEPSDYLPDRIHISSHAADAGLIPWPTFSASCTWILGKARQLDCEWLLFIDADQELHNGDRLHDWLPTDDAIAAPIRRSEPTGLQMTCPWHLVHVPSIARYVSGCSVVETPTGDTIDLVPPGPLDPWPPGSPWISHHPDRRPPWRRGLRLGQYETILEPPPAHRRFALHPDG